MAYFIRNILPKIVAIEPCM